MKRMDKEGCGGGHRAPLTRTGMSRASEAHSIIPEHESKSTVVFETGMRTEVRPDLRILPPRGIKSSAPPDDVDRYYSCVTLTMLLMLM